MDNVVSTQETSVKKMNPVEKAKGFLSAVMATAFAVAMNGMPVSAFTYCQANINTSMSTNAVDVLGSAVGLVLMVIAGFGLGVLIVGFVDVAQSFMSDQPEKRTKGFALIIAGVIMIGLRSVLSMANILG